MPTIASTLIPSSHPNRFRSQSVSNALSTSKQSVEPPLANFMGVLDAIREKPGVLYRVPTSANDSHSNGHSHKDHAPVVKWDVSVWNEQVQEQQHHHPRPKRPKLTRGSPLQKPSTMMIERVFEVEPQTLLLPEQSLFLQSHELLPPLVSSSVP